MQWSRKIQQALACAALALAPAAYAADKYMIASVVGNGFTVTQAQMQTGSNVDRNKRFAFDLPKHVMDDQVMLAVEDVLKRACSACATTLARLDPALFDESNEGAVPEAVLDAARKAGVQRLVLLTKHRGETQIKTREGLVGQGRLRGLGFFIDTELEVIDQETLARSEGFLAPYAYFRLQVIDVAQSGLVLNRPIRASTSMAVPRPKGGSIWDGVSPEKKTQALLALVREEVAKSLPPVVTR
jgi:hypothetical protein